MKDDGIVVFRENLAIFFCLRSLFPTCYNLVGFLFLALCSLVRFKHFVVWSRIKQLVTNFYY